MLQFGFHLQLFAQILVTVVGAIVAFSMFIGMIKTIRSGKYGVDLLAIMAVVATLAVSEYWAAMVILVMLTGGDALEDYAAKKASTELKALLNNSPQTAHLITNGKTSDIPVNDVKVGDQLIVKQGIQALGQKVCSVMYRHDDRDLAPFGGRFALASG